MNVEELIKKSLQELRKIACENPNESEKSSGKQDSRLIFPKYRNNNIRISEEEARFLFVHELEKQKDKHHFYYSIETPTKKPYKEFSTDEPKIEGKGSRSGCVDVTLYNNIFQREHLIEFKFGNVDTCTKDFLKLLCDDEYGTKNYYINILENYSVSTLESLEEKYREAIKYIFQKYSHEIMSELLIVVGVLKKDKNNFFVYKKIDKNNQSIEIDKTEKIEI